MMKSKNIFEMTTDEYFAHLKKEHKLFIKNKGCPVCLGDGKLKEGGMFSKTYKCENCNGKGKLI